VTRVREQRLLEGKLELRDPSSYTGAYLVVWNMDFISPIAGMIIQSDELIFEKRD
jgi:hypothetical protein